MAKAKKTSTSRRTTAQKKAAKKAAARRPAPKRPRASARRLTAGLADEGPVSLAEAKTLAQAQAPVRTVRRRASVAERAATHATVAAERNNLEEQIESENERRIREYKEVMTIMKSRGVKGLEPTALEPEPDRRGSAALRRTQPLQIFAEGDSWFDYPVPFFGGGIIPRLEKRLGVPILSLAKAGDEVRNMLGVEERRILSEQLMNGSPAGGPWDLLLFSGGGNDIVGNPMALWVRDFNGTVPPANLISQARFEAALQLVHAGYEDLIQMRDALSPSTHLAFHAYDLAIPDGRGICGFGPWLKPTFDLRGFTSMAPATAVVSAMLKQFAVTLQALAANHSGVSFINTQGTLAPVASSWHNELHPSKAGFTAIADVFHAALKGLFPGRVL